MCLSIGILWGEDFVSATSINPLCNVQSKASNKAELEQSFCFYYPYTITQTIWVLSSFVHSFSKLSRLSLRYRFRRERIYCRELLKVNEEECMWNMFLWNDVFFVFIFCIWSPNYLSVCLAGSPIGSMCFV